MFQITAQAEWTPTPGRGNKREILEVLGFRAEIEEQVAPFAGEAPLWQWKLRDNLTGQVRFAEGRDWPDAAEAKRQAEMSIHRVSGTTKGQAEMAIHRLSDTASADQALGRKFDASETATLLAALRFYQGAGMGDPDNRPVEIHEIATDGGEVVSLDDAGIDELCVRLNS